MKIIDTPIDQVVPYSGNPHTHPATQVAALARSIRDHGWTQPIVTDAAGVVIVGHGRLLAARSLCLAVVPVLRADHLTADQARAYRLADNRLAEDAGWDDALLLTEILALGQANYDLTATAFSLTELTRLQDGRGLDGHATAAPVAGAGDPDAAPARGQGPAVSRPGEVYHLGPHRLACGDCRDQVLWDRLLADRRVDAVVTDPPYGVSYDGVLNDDLPADDLRRLLADAYGLLLVRCRPGAAWYVCSPGGPALLIVGGPLADLGVWRQTIVWVKDSLVLGRSDYHYRHELILAGGAPTADPQAEALVYGWAPGGPHAAYGDRRQDTVWECPRPKRSADHPTMKPTELLGRAIVNSTRQGDLVADPFAGSGSTLIAAAMFGRVAAVCELSPEYCDVIRRRWTTFADANHLDAGSGELR